MGKTSTASKRKYNEKAYERVALSVKRGEKDKIKAHAESLGMSLNAYIVKLIENDMNQEN